MTFLFHKTRLAVADVRFFIGQLQAYCHSEVIDCSWRVLEDFAMKKEGDLDSLIEAHATYLDRLVNKALLITTKGGVPVSVLIPWFQTSTDDRSRTKRCSTRCEKSLRSFSSTVRLS